MRTELKRTILILAAINLIGCGDRNHQTIAENKSLKEPDYCASAKHDADEWKKRYQELLADCGGYDSFESSDGAFLTLLEQGTEDKVLDEP